ncbi:hypothetical protein H7097_03145 [Aeromicrobium sp.]|nr:hypothetical protein [Candidatus Saccharibacteria bacterium]
MNGFESTERFTQTDLIFDSLTLRLSDTPEHEKLARSEAYRTVGSLVDRLLPEGDSAEGLHKHPIEHAGDNGDRIVFICRENVPDHGRLTRVIVNDVVREPVTLGRSVLIKDYVLNSVQKAVTFQQTEIHRQGDAHAWSLRAGTGPLLGMSSGTLNIYSGTNYMLNMPRSRGYPHTMPALIEHRILLETLAETLSPLNGVTAEPGYSAFSGIMS